ncbi:hypothetical protein SAMN05421780_102280 [Flexibacter flexilis DSM 6793]|uniref:Lipoprotein n=1 Tax=Flexibacter flexilis DSM 6793 TaxID=927664 RepID=A0A1I1FQC6_9BACT|nr:hypothetical protein [Flexibacter flexilis]SFC01544.1 hypothetical protein SAMN05421780_102280 [Flexibacter flexilis DSM 6793]
MKKYTHLLLSFLIIGLAASCSNKSYPCPDNGGDMQISTKRGDGVGKLKTSSTGMDKNGLLKKRKKYSHSGMN